MEKSMNPQIAIILFVQTGLALILAFLSRSFLRWVWEIGSTFAPRDTSLRHSIIPTAGFYSFLDFW